MLPGRLLSASEAAETLLECRSQPWRVARDGCCIDGRAMTHGAQNTRRWRRLLREDAERYERHRQSDSLRSRRYRVNLSGAKRAVANEKSRERARRYRARKKIELQQCKVEVKSDH